MNNVHYLVAATAVTPTTRRPARRRAGQGRAMLLGGVGAFLLGMAMSGLVVMAARGWGAAVDLFALWLGMPWA